MMLLTGSTLPQSIPQDDGVARKRQRRPAGDFRRVWTVERIVLRQLLSPTSADRFQFLRHRREAVPSLSLASRTSGVGDVTGRRRVLPEGVGCRRGRVDSGLHGRRRGLRSVSDRRQVVGVLGHGRGVGVGIGSSVGGDGVGAAELLRCLIRMLR